MQTIDRPAHRHPRPGRPRRPSWCSPRARRRDTGAAIGALARETRKRDRGSRRRRPRPPPSPTTGREVERAAALEQREGGATWSRVGAVGAGGLGAARPRGHGRHPPAVPQPRRSSPSSAWASAASAPRCSPSSGPSSASGSASSISVGTITDIEARRSSDGHGFAYYPEGRMWVTTYPAAALAKAKKMYSAAELTGMEAGVLGALPEVRAPRLPRAVLPHVAVVRVPVPRLAVQPRSARRRAARRRVASTGSR